MRDGGPDPLGNVGPVERGLVTHVRRATDLVSAQWRKSIRSGDTGGSSVEVADLMPVLAVRDSKDPGGPALLFERAAWSLFIVGLRTGLRG